MGRQKAATLNWKEKKLYVHFIAVYWVITLQIIHVKLGYPLETYYLVNFKPRIIHSLLSLVEEKKKKWIDFKFISEIRKNATKITRIIHRNSLLKKNLFSLSDVNFLTEHKRGNRWRLLKFHCTGVLRSLQWILTRDVLRLEKIDFDLLSNSSAVMAVKD